MVSPKQVKVSKQPISQKVRYTMIHLVFLSFFGGAVPPVDGPASILRVCLSARTRSMNSLSRFCAVFAEVSRNSQPNCRARAASSSFATSRSYVLSHLLPASMKMGFPRFARRINWQKTSRPSNVDRYAMEYTRMKPWPSLAGGEQRFQMLLDGD